MLEPRLLSASTSFAATASAWAISVGLLDAESNPTAIYPTIIGMPDGSEDLGAFNIGIIQSNRTIKAALQDLETAVDGRMFASNNLSDLPNKETARTNLGLGTAATWPVGTSGATLGLLSTVNTYTGKQNFSGGISATTVIDLTGASGAQSAINILNGTSLRWKIYKEETADSATSTGSDLRIGRYNNSGVFIDNVLTISRTTGAITLSQPLPITSGGTGANSIATLKTALALNNVDNTADINKPISSATQTALNAKYDRSGGTITGFISVNSYARIGGTLAVDGNSTEGGQITIGYKDTASLTGQANSTWNIDVNATNALRIFRQNSAGVIYTPIQIEEAGNTTMNGNGSITSFVGTGSSIQGVTLRNADASSSAAGSLFVDFRNTENIPVTSISSAIATSGSGELSVFATAAGARGTDRRVEVFKFGAAAITANVPINGRAYPRLENGGDLKMNWSAQTGQPTGLWGGNDGTNMYVYNPSNFSVSNAVNLGNIVGGNAGGYIRRTTDTVGNGALSRQLVLAGNTVTNDVWSAPIEIREVNNNGSGSTATTYAPALLFNWNSVASSAIKLHSDGSFRFQAQSSSSVTYVPTYASMCNLWGSTAGIYFNSYSRGVSTAETNAGYGHLTTVGTGMNAYAGYSVNTWITLMANGTDSGLYSSSQGRWLVRFDTSGNAFFPANISAYSDERLKKNIRPIDRVAERREAMAKAAILYERDDQTRLGFGAQTLELGNPELVTTSDDPTGTKLVNYGDAVAVLAADNQLLADRLAEAEAKNALLQNQIADILSRLEKAGL